MHIPLGLDFVDIVSMGGVLYVIFSHGDGLGKVMARQIYREIWSCGVKLGVNCINPVFRYGTEGGLVQVFDNIFIFGEFVYIIGAGSGCWGSRCNVYHPYARCIIMLAG